MSKIKRRKKQHLSKFFWQLLRHNPILLVGGVWLSMVTSGVVGWVKLTDPGKETGAYPPSEHITPTQLAETAEKPANKGASPLWGVAALFFGGVSASLLIDNSPEKKKERNKQFQAVKSKPLPKPSPHQIKQRGIPPFSPTIASFNHHRPATLLNNSPTPQNIVKVTNTQPVAVTASTQKQPQKNVLPPKLSFPVEKQQKNPIKLINLP